MKAKGCFNPKCRYCKIKGCGKYIETKQGDFICGKNYLCTKCKTSHNENKNKFGDLAK